MVRKLNRHVAEAYSENFSSKVLDNFFSSHQAASGQDILEFTPVQQVNLLVVQRFYQRWQDEALRLRSPYFNFEHPQVQESLQAFMNTLSRHILVERHALEPLLQAAVMDTLRLLFNPMAFFDEFLRLYTNKETLLASLRYLRLQESLTDVLHEQIEEKETTEPEYLLAMLEAGIRSGKLALEPVEEHVQEFEQVLSLPYNLAEEPMAAPAAVEPPKEEPSNFFSAISQRSPRSSKPAPRPLEAERNEPVKEAPAATAQPTPIAEPRIEAPRTTRTEPAPAPQAPFKPEVTVPHQQPAATTAPASAPVPAKDNKPASKKQEEDNRSLNTRFERTEKKPLYEKFEPKEPRNSMITNKQRSSTNIRHYITLNQRFMFVKELFGGDGGAFNAALDALDACQNLQEARQWVQEHLAPKPQWQPDSEIVLEFERVLENRFSS